VTAGQSFLLTERRSAGWTRLVLNRPGRRNALTPVIATALLNALRADPAAILVLASSDRSAFCAGADLDITDSERSAVSDRVYQICEEMITRPGPVIAAVGGAAVGGGAQIAAAADIRIAGPGARLRWIGPPGGELAVGSWILPALAGRAAALDLALTGRWVGASEAMAMGLVSRIEDDPDRAAAELAADLSAAPGGSAGMGAVKAVMAARGLLDALHAERDANRLAWDRLLGQAGRAGRSVR
jgi:enoyl-CoA hydratase